MNSPPKLPKDHDISSFTNKDLDATPRSNKRAQFSPISELNKLVLNTNTPLVNARDNHFDCESNYNEEEDNRS